MSDYATKPVKPLGRKAYGSIGHIHGSRLGPGDHHVHEGQTAMCTTKAPKDKTILVQTKLDGSCVAVANIDGEIVALGRAGYPANTSPHRQHHLFHDWVLNNRQRFARALKPGQRFVGEWLALAHGTRYHLNWYREPFVAFDLMEGDKRSPYEQFYEAATWVFLAVPDTILGPMDPVDAMRILDTYGAEEPEGVVYRCESAKGVDFVAKWVRADKVDGKYFDVEHWNWQP